MYRTYVGNQEIVGDEEIVGAEFVGDSDIDRLLAMGAEAAAAQAQGGRGLPRAGRVVSTVDAKLGLWKKHYLPLNLVGATTVAGAGGTGTLQNNPQRLFKPSRLIVPSDVAGLFSILNIFIGVKPQLVATGSMPARVFSETSFDTDFEGDTAQISQSVAVQVVNNSLGASPISAAMRGLTVM
jgi:hypothetical protein